MRKQQTLARPVVLEGFGFWSGQDVRMEFRPSSENNGLRFFRTDLEYSTPIPALIQYRIDKPRQSSLVYDGIQVDMIEHVMAALYGLHIDNCDIMINGAEMPGFDGSSRPFFEVLRGAGCIVQNEIRPYRIIKSRKRFGSGDTYIEVQPSRENILLFGYSLIYDDICGEGMKSCHPIGNQTYFLPLTSETFEKEIVSARTYLMFQEAQYLLDHGLCQRVQARDVLVFDQEGPIDNTLRYENECARHKILDMVGDFALAGCDWVGEFHAHRTGHHHNAETIKELLISTDLQMN